MPINISEVEFYQIKAPHFCSGLGTNPHTNTVVCAAPIIKYMVGWPFERVQFYCKNKNWELTYINRDRTNGETDE